MASHSRSSPTPEPPSSDIGLFERVQQRCKFLDIEDDTRSAAFRLLSRLLKSGGRVLVELEDKFFDTCIFSAALKECDMVATAVVITYGATMTPEERATLLDRMRYFQSREDGRGTRDLSLLYSKMLQLTPNTIIAAEELTDAMEEKGLVQPNQNRPATAAACVFAASSLGKEDKTSHEVISVAGLEGAESWFWDVYKPLFERKHELLTKSIMECFQSPGELPEPSSAV